MEKQRLVAVIDIGSLAIRIVIAEIHPGGLWKILDRSERPIALGLDVFTNGVVNRESMSQALQILSGFREMLKGWQIINSDVHVIATSALREAGNRDTFIDRVELQTGLLINVIEGIEANRLTYFAVKNALKDSDLNFDRANSIIMEVGGGSTELMLLEQGRMAAAHTMNIGTVRIEQQVRSILGSSDFLIRYLTENIRAALDIIGKEFRLGRIESFIAVGGDARLAARRVGKPVNEHCTSVEKNKFEDFIQEIQNCSVDDLVHQHQIPYSDAEGLVPALLIYKLFLEKTSAVKLLVPDVSIREGVLLGLSGSADPGMQAEFNSQITASAISLGRKYNFDETHAQHVTQLALALFDQLQDTHRLDGTSRMLLEVAGILHDIGTFIQSSSHHKHGQYLTANSEIFGLRADDVRIVSNVVRYHRKSQPKSYHLAYISLTRERRIVVLKLASMLRVADALDKGHRQRISNIHVEQKDGDLLIQSTNFGDISMERYGLAQKAKMMEDVFGLRAVLA